MTRIYVCGPMSGYPDLNWPAFNAESARLRGLGYEVVNPAEINADPAEKWSDCMRKDIAELVTCDGVALLPNYHTSRGATLEVHIAKALGMQVRQAAAFGLSGEKCRGIRDAAKRAVANAMPILKGWTS